MTKQELEKIIIDALLDIDGKKKLPCAKAFAIKDQHGVALKDIYELCNEKKIKISQCQLGCFQ